MTRVDHLLVSVADLESARQRWADAGLPATEGGRHPGGTSNALVRGPSPAYLELITAAPGSSSAVAQRVLGNPGPLSWALGVDHIDELRASLVAAGHEPGEVHAGSRENPDGAVLRWRVCDLAVEPLHPFVPFLIEWETPMRAGPARGPVLQEVTIACPDPAALGDLLQVCGLHPGASQSTWTDGEVTVRLEDGGEGIRSARIALDAAPDDSVVLDGLLVERRRHEAPPVT